MVDIRRYPGSRRHPHFDRAALVADLPPVGIAYRWDGTDLGGRRARREPSRHPAWRDESFRAYADHMDTLGFQTALERLMAEADIRPLAVMCAETLWWRCHRRLVADASSVAGVEVVHLLDDGKRQAHVLHPALRVDDEGRPVYDVWVPGELLS